MNGNRKRRFRCCALQDQEFQIRSEPKEARRMKKCTVRKVVIQSDGQDMDLYVVEPTVSRKLRAQTPGILWMHGGGYVMGSAKMIYLSRAMDLVKKYGAVVVLHRSIASPGKRPIRRH